MNGFYAQFYKGTLNVYSSDCEQHIKKNGLNFFGYPRKLGAYPPFHNPHGPARINSYGEYYFLEGIPQKVAKIRLRKFMKNF